MSSGAVGQRNARVAQRIEDRVEAIVALGDERDDMPPRALASWMLPSIFSKTASLRRDRHHRQLLVDERDRAVLHLAGRVALGVDVGDLLQLQRALERDRVLNAAPEVEEVGALIAALGELLDLRLASAAPPR